MFLRHRGGKKTTFFNVIFPFINLTSEDGVPGGFSHSAKKEKKQNKLLFFFKSPA